jgi:hypothetical protein
MEPFATTRIKYTLTNNETLETELKFFTYSDKSIAIQMSEHFGKAMTEELTKLYGRYNPKLKIGPGWVFSNSRYPEIQTLLQKIIKGEIKGAIPKTYTKSIGSDEEPAILKAFKVCVQATGGIEGYQQFNDYFFGEREKVYARVKELNKTIVSELYTGTKVIVSTI